MHGDAENGTFSSKYSKLHLEIPFFTIPEPVSCQVESSSGPFVAVYFRVTHPAFLFRGADTLSQMTVWNPNHDAEFDDVQYKRTVDFTTNKAWAKSSAIRIFFSVSSNNDREVYKLFLSRMRETRLGSKHLGKKPTLVRTIMKPEFVPLADVIHDAARVHRIPFIVRYQFEVIVSAKVISIEGLT